MTGQRSLLSRFSNFSFLFGARWKTSRNEARQHQFQLQISPAKMSLLLSLPHGEIDTIVHPNCIQKCSWCFISEHSCPVEFLYFFICYCIGTIGLVSLSYGLKLFLFLFQDILNLTEFLVVQNGKCASFLTEVAVNTLQKPS